MQLEFLGATGTVTGSKYLVTSGERRLLVDCRLFQGLKQLRLRNWADVPFHASQIDAVVLTHAHIDRSGFIPRLVQQGFRMSRCWSTMGGPAMRPETASLARGSPFAPMMDVLNEATVIRPAPAAVQASHLAPHRCVTRESTMRTPLATSLILCAVAAVSPVQAAVTDAVTASDTRLSAGPSSDYPAVATLPAGTRIIVQGCLSDFSWCDVIAESGRGWVDADIITRPQEGAVVTVRGSGAGMGIGTVDFDLLAYWTQHYSDQPWYEERERWARGPRAIRPTWPQFPGQPPIRPQPPPPPTPPKQPAQPIMPNPPRS